MSLAKTIASNIREFRKERGMTQLDLAAAMGVTQSAVSKNESGERDIPLDFIEHAARVLACSIAELVGGERPSPPLLLDSEDDRNELLKQATVNLLLLVNPESFENPTLADLIGKLQMVLRMTQGEVL